MNETSWITGFDCNRNSKGLFWFNAEDSDSIDNQTLYQGDFDGEKIEAIIENIRNPRSLTLDDEYN